MNKGKDINKHGKTRQGRARYDETPRRNHTRHDTTRKDHTKTRPAKAMSRQDNHKNNTTRHDLFLRTSVSFLGLHLYTGTQGREGSKGK